MIALKVSVGALQVIVAQCTEGQRRLLAAFYYGVAMISRLLKILVLFCKRAL